MISEVKNIKNNSVSISPTSYDGVQLANHPSILRETHNVKLSPTKKCQPLKGPTPKNKKGKTVNTATEQLNNITTKAKMSLVMMVSDPLQLVSFVHRGCKGELVGQDWQKMNEILVELTPESLSATLEKCYDNQRNQSMHNFPSIS